MQRDAACRRRRAGELGNAGDHPAGGAELGDGGELVDRGRQAHLEPCERVLDGGVAAVDECPQRAHEHGQRVAQLLGVGRAGVVEAGAVDDHDAGRRCLVRPLLRHAGERGELAAGIVAGSVRGPLAERIGPERPDAVGGRDAARLPQREQRLTGSLPAGAGVEHDRRRGELHAIEHSVEQRGVDGGRRPQVDEQ